MTAEGVYTASRSQLGCAVRNATRLPFGKGHNHGLLSTTKVHRTNLNVLILPWVVLVVINTLVIDATTTT